MLPDYPIPDSAPHPGSRSPGLALLMLTSNNVVSKFELFGFRIQVESAPPSSLETQAAGARSRNAIQASSSLKRILIVDDDPVFLKATATQLTSAGFQVATAQKCSEAVAVLGEQPADVILLDLQFPIKQAKPVIGTWSGFQLLYWLRGLPSTKEARFIIVSASDSPANRKRAQQLGASAYFQKPLDHEKLIAAINAMAERVRLPL